jgi:hypothetical protein
MMFEFQVDCTFRSRENDTLYCIGPGNFIYLRNVLQFGLDEKAL